MGIEKTFPVGFVRVMILRQIELMKKKNKNKIFYFIITKSPLLRICKQKRNPFWRNHDYTSHDRFGGPANPSVLLI